MCSDSPPTIITAVLVLKHGCHSREPPEMGTYHSVSAYHHFRMNLRLSHQPHCSKSTPDHCFTLPTAVNRCSSRLTRSNPETPLTARHSVCLYVQTVCMNLLSSSPSFFFALALFPGLQWTSSWAKLCSDCPKSLIPSLGLAPFLVARTPYRRPRGDEGVRG